MAHLVLTVDPQAARRRQFARAAQAQAPLAPGAQLRRLEQGELSLAWTTGANVPQSLSQRPDGCALLLGRALDDAGSAWDAARLLDHWRTGGDSLPTFDGYYVGVVYRPERGLALVCDPLGLFPLYHNGRRDVLVAGSSPQWCAVHPQVDTSLDVAGLAGILLVNGLLNNRPLIRGLKRLAAGKRLEWTSRAGAREVEVFRLHGGSCGHYASSAELREHLDSEVRRAIRRHRPPNVATRLLLSGGLDSRLLAGYLKDESVSFTPLTWGQASDLELRAAADVAATLELPLSCELQEPAGERFVEAARAAARWEHLAGGFGALETWPGDLEPDADDAPFFWSGFAVDDALGGCGFAGGHDAKTGRWSFETFLHKANRWGLAPRLLKRLLLCSQAEELVDDLLANWRHDYERPELSAPQRSFRGRLQNRVRFHIGSILHRLSFRRWPLLPMFDRRILQLLFNLDPQALLGRRMELALLGSGFPALARIPFDTNSYRFGHTHVKGGRNAVTVVERAADWLRYRGRRWYWQRWRRAEPRRYYRLYDVDQPCWQAVRAAAEAHRGSLGEHLDRTLLGELLPPAEVRIGCADPFGEGAARRTLLGLLLWHARDPAARPVQVGVCADQPGVAGRNGESQARSVRRGPKRAQLATAWAKWRAGTGCPAAAAGAQLTGRVPR